MCHCGKEKDFDACCGMYISGEESAPTAETLMRSRYCAFVVHDFDYLQETQDIQTIEKFNLAANQKWAESVNFTHLEILRAEESGNKGLVEFRAKYKDKSTGEEHIHHEVSKFRKQKGIWYFREGAVKAI
jgi:SEC-C motif-containing protein